MPFVRAPYQIEHHFANAAGLATPGMSNLVFASGPPVRVLTRIDNVFSGHPGVATFEQLFKCSSVATL